MSDKRYENTQKLLGNNEDVNLELIEKLAEAEKQHLSDMPKTSHEELISRLKVRHKKD